MIIPFIYADMFTSRIKNRNSHLSYDAANLLNAKG